MPYSRTNDMRAQVATHLPHPESIQESTTSSDITALIDLIQSPACLLSGTGGVIRENDAWRKSMPLSEVMPEQTAIPPWILLIDAEDRHVALSQFRQATQKGQRTEFECRLKNRDNTARWFLLSLQPLPETAATATPYQWLCLATDIHDIKIRELELKRLTSVHTDMLNISVDCIKVIAADGTLIHMNRAGCEALGVPQDCFGLPWLPLLPEDVWSTGEKALTRARQGTFSRFPGKSVLPGRLPQYWDNMLTPVIGADGAVNAILCVSREVTTEYAATQALKQSEARLAVAVQVGGLGIWDYDFNTGDMHCDETWHRIMNCDPTTSIRSFSEFQHLLHPDDLAHIMRGRASAGDYLILNVDKPFIFRIIRNDGDIRWIRCAANVVRDADGNPESAVGYVTDITEDWRNQTALRDANRALEEEKLLFARQSLEDPLTGIPNRRSLDNQLSRLVHASAQTESTIAVGMIDVDHFKAYNDRYGHLMGDNALRRVAQALYAVARTTDCVARYGGEEFAFILTSNAATHAEAILERFMKAAAELAIVHQDEAGGLLTISIGCVLAKLDNSLSPQTLLKAGDEALYEAKSTGRNRFVLRTMNAEPR